MPKEKYTPEFKTKVVLNIIQGEKEFLQNAHLAFDLEAEHKTARRKAAYKL